MHIEKHFFENIFNTVMNVMGKTKDSEKARRDLRWYCKRKDLMLKVQDNRKIVKPKVNYTLTTDEAELVCRWIKEFKMPDGYSSNLARCADVEKGRIHGIKSHYRHVFMDTLLPIAFSTLPIHVLNSLTEISRFFQRFVLYNIKREIPKKNEGKYCNYSLQIRENIPSWIV